MSPRRRVQPTSQDLFRLPYSPPPRRRLAIAATVAAMLVVVAVTASAMIFAKRQAERRIEVREAAVLSFVRSFITEYTSPDPFNANAYADRVLALGTGNFAKLYKEKMNEVVVQVARAERGFGTVQEIGIERWNDDGSADVVAVASMTTTMPDGKKFDSGSRWVVTAVREGEQWKVSNLIQVL